MRNSNRQPAQRRAAFALAEAVMLVLVAGVALSLLLAAGARTRSAAGLNRDLGNLRQIGQWRSAYAADNEDRFATLSSAPNSQWSQLLPTGNALDDAARHAIDIIRRRTGREDFPLPRGWFPHLMYSHLALADYLDGPLPDRRWVSTGDVHRTNWTDDPINKFDQGFWQPYQQPQSGGAPSAVDRRWPYSSSYQPSAAWIDAGQSEWQTLGRIYQVSHVGYAIPANAALGGQPLSLAAFPSQKVMVHDWGDWYHAQQARYYSHQDAATGETARVAMLLSDGSAGVFATSDANPGWNPPLPADPGATEYTYTPRDWEPRTLNGSSAEVISAGVYAWTRGGLLGRDFGGEEIDTGQR